MKQQDFRPELLPTLRSLEIQAKQHVLSTTFVGNWISKIRGHGIEFWGYRQYTAADDATRIDWKASIRSKKLLVKELDEEKNLNIFLLLDTSDTMLFGSGDKLKAEYAAEVVSSLAYAALRSGESVSVSLVSDRMRRFIPPQMGVEHHAAVMKSLNDVKNYSGPKNLSHAVNQLIAMMPAPGLIILVSDFINLSDADERSIKVLAQKFDLIGLCVRDQRDRELPASGEFILSDPTSGDKIVVDAADYAKPYKEYVAAEEDRLRLLFRRSGADLLFLMPTDDFGKLITKFLVLHNKRVE
jgi:uncharacterized protein (DUF58 family)